MDHPSGYPGTVADYQDLAVRIKEWGEELGFQKIGISDCNLSEASQHLREWLQSHFHGEMDYMRRHASVRSKPEELLPGTVRIISVRMDYLPESMQTTEKILNDPTRGFVSRYALGRDYHKVVRKRLQRLAARIAGKVGRFGYRAFSDSAPVLEKAIAEKAGLGWIGKHTNLIDKNCGSWFFLGEIYTDLPLPVDPPARAHCGSCAACIEICPTQAILAPYRLDARRCISYLTIELKGSIPIEFRPLIGNRIYGCDDCQLVCPWNKFAKLSRESAFTPRAELASGRLLEFFSWNESNFLAKTEGSAIRRIGYTRWLRNIAVALGNQPHDREVIKALLDRCNHPSELVREHIRWALDRQNSGPAHLELETSEGPTEIQNNAFSSRRSRP